MAKLNEIIDNAVEKSSTQLANQIAADKVTGTLAPNPMQARTAPAQDVYDQDYGMESPLTKFSPGRMRPMWDQPTVALTHTPISSWLNSGQAQNTEVSQIIGGVAQNVLAPPSGASLTPVPNMQVVLRANGPVHLTATLSVQSNISCDTVAFAFYRTGKQISQIFTETTSNAANSPRLVNLSMIDSNLDAHAPLNSEVYALYWAAASTNLIAVGAQRSFFAINLTPQ